MPRYLKGDLAEYYGLKDQSGVLVASVVPGDPIAVRLRKFVTDHRVLKLCNNGP
jgi:hypothetical protein